MMNYSDYDSDGYSSNDDADYVPSDDDLSEDDINECEKEEPLEGGDVPHLDYVSKKKRKKMDISVRKRNKRVLKVDKEEKGGDGAEEAQLPQEEVEINQVLEKDDDAKQKKKSDDLWASFLSDVGTRPKDCTTASQSSTTQKDESSVLKVAPWSIETKVSEAAKVTITKVFDFAGEEVRVNKEVSADSRDAKSYLKSQNTKHKENEDDAEMSLSTRQPTLPGPSAKRPAGVTSILSRIGGKKQKMSTLEKSKMDWDAFKSEEGITEELAIHNRGREGYVERKNFLERVDHRQFELEKAVRLSNMKQ
ncbi:Craniofacial development protein 1 Bucentaur [Larimichthys crocea]|uniref:Craniofacial development protein 1 n=1 Tax=Larimichthys crocea TaxID=215358 RepID=A0A6G0IZ86_LARCR|nr:craniofacial development protein 1 isoform X2 [Larimichthys crocea]KAE8296835.1 Craniofacial development protein 1 Bucentaur [Larimichthys crocea]